MNEVEDYKTSCVDVGYTFIYHYIILAAHSLTVLNLSNSVCGMWTLFLFLIDVVSSTQNNTVESRGLNHYHWSRFLHEQEMMYALSLL